MSRRAASSTASTRRRIAKVVDHCYLCDMCYMTKCPYVPPHPWNVDFPHLMLRAKAVKHRSGETRWRDRVLSSTDLVGNIAGIPGDRRGRQRGQSQHRWGARCSMPRSACIPTRRCPPYRSDTLRKQLRGGAAAVRRPSAAAGAARPRDARRQGRAVRHLLRQPQRAGDRSRSGRVFEHNGIEVALAERENCCGMPKLELGDLEAVAELKARTCRSCSR